MAQRLQPQRGGTFADADRDASNCRTSRDFDGVGQRKIVRSFFVGRLCEHLQLVRTAAWELDVKYDLTIRILRMSLPHCRVLRFSLRPPRKIQPRGNSHVRWTRERHGQRLLAIVFYFVIGVAQRLQPQRGGTFADADRDASNCRTSREIHEIIEDVRKTFRMLRSLLPVYVDPKVPGFSPHKFQIHFHLGGRIAHQRTCRVVQLHGPAALLQEGDASGKLHVRRASKLYEKRRLSLVLNRVAVQRVILVQAQTQVKKIRTQQRHLGPGRFAHG